MQNKLKVHKIKLLGQDYLIKTSNSDNMQDIENYVKDKMQEVIDSGIDETPDSNSVRNDMGAFGGPGGNWLPYGYTYTSEVEDVNQ